MVNKRGGAARPCPFLSRSVSRCYRTILRAKRPPPTSSAPAPRANRDATPLPPLAGSCFGAGAGAGAGAGGGGGAAFGGGAGAALGGSGSHGALATTPPALETMYPSLHSASAVAPPALASLALASATTAGSSWARAGEAATMATASIAANIINFLNLPTSSNSNSSAVEAYCRMGSTLCGLPVFATPWMPAHWVELLPSWVAEKS